jgi:hypothetical protein
MGQYRRHSAVIGAFSIAAILLLAYSHFTVLLVSNQAQTVKVTALLPTAATEHLQQKHQFTIHGSSTINDLGGAQQEKNALWVPGPLEIWAAGPQHTEQRQQLLTLLDPGVLAQLRTLCGRCLYRTLNSYVHVHDFGRVAVVLTGDIPAMWIRDSAVQMPYYFPRISRRPAMRQVLEGAIRAHSYFILQVTAAQQT